MMCAILSPSDLASDAIGLTGDDREIMRTIADGIDILTTGGFQEGAEARITEQAVSKLSPLARDYAGLHGIDVTKEYKPLGEFVEIVDNLTGYGANGVFRTNALQDFLKKMGEED